MFSTSTTELPPVSEFERGGLRIAAIVPCYNEALSVTSVVCALRDAVPGVTAYVYDNNCTDGTAEAAEQAGAIVRRETLKGKGNVVRRAFADIDADIYLLIDGDDTYDASRAGELIDLLLEGPYDQVIGTRSGSAYRRGHAAGNRMFNMLVSALFGTPVRDMLSGYRVLSRRFVKSFPALSREFEIETELTVHAMNLRVPQVEALVGFKERPEGSESKLRTVHDGTRILWLITELTRHERPMLYFGLISSVMFAGSLLLGLPVVAEFAATGVVPRLPTAILASSLMILTLLMLVSGLVLDGLRRSRRESTRLAYLALPALDRTGNENDAHQHRRVRVS